jgi:DNA-binding transcriptional LysR family regulator
LIQDYRSKFPDVEPRLQHMNPDEQLAAFDQGRTDVGLSRSLPPERRASFNETTVYTDYLMIALPGTHTLAKERAIKLKKLAGEPFVLFHRLGNPSAFDEIVAIVVAPDFLPG